MSTFWLGVELLWKAVTSIHRGMVLSHPSTHFWLVVLFRAIGDWRYMIYSSRF
ncbi:hypothetical protein H6G69_18275 [Nostoc sp. FACHB-110]|nr:hypothetical protein [Nostoc sp. FACHB-110]